MVVRDAVAEDRSPESDRGYWHDPLRDPCHGDASDVVGRAEGQFQWEPVVFQISGRLLKISVAGMGMMLRFSGSCLDEGPRIFPRFPDLRRDLGAGSCRSGIFPELAEHGRESWKGRGE